MQVPLHESLDGQTALVTGANRGIGEEIALRLAQAGAHVYAGIRDPDRSKAPEGTTPLRLDVTQDEDAQAAKGIVEKHTEQLDILVNNAGVVAEVGHTLLDQPMEQIDQVLRVNLRGPILVTKTFLPMLLERPGSRVVNISSGMGNLEGMNGGAPAYRISKTGVNGLTTYLNGEYHTSHGLISNCVCPGWVQTDMGGRHASRPVEKGAETPVWLSRFYEGAPSGHWWRDKKIIPW